jgi:hypothetical protein
VLAVIIAGLFLVIVLYAAVSEPGDEPKPPRSIRQRAALRAPGFVIRWQCARIAAAIQRDFDRRNDEEEQPR